MHAARDGASLRTSAKRKKPSFQTGCKAANRQLVTASICPTFCCCDRILPSAHYARHQCPPSHIPPPLVPPPLPLLPFLPDLGLTLFLLILNFCHTISFMGSPRSPPLLPPIFPNTPFLRNTSFGQEKGRAPCRRRQLSDPENMDARPSIIPGRHGWKLEKIDMRDEQKA